MQCVFFFFCFCFDIQLKIILTPRPLARYTCPNLQAMVH